MNRFTRVPAARYGGVLRTAPAGRQARGHYFDSYGQSKRGISDVLTARAAGAESVFTRSCRQEADACYAAMAEARAGVMQFCIIRTSVLHVWAEVLILHEGPDDCPSRADGATLRALSDMSVSVVPPTTC